MLKTTAKSGRVQIGGFEAKRKSSEVKSRISAIPFEKDEVQVRAYFMTCVQNGWSKDDPSAPFHGDRLCQDILIREMLGVPEVYNEHDPETFELFKIPQGLYCKEAMETILWAIVLPGTTYPYRGTVDENEEHEVNMEKLTPEMQDSFLNSYLTVLKTLKPEYAALTLEDARAKFAELCSDDRAFASTLRKATNKIITNFVTLRCDFLTVSAKTFTVKLDTEGSKKSGYASGTLATEEEDEGVQLRQAYSINKLLSDAAEIKWRNLPETHEKFNDLDTDTAVKDRFLYIYGDFKNKAHIPVSRPKDEFYHFCVSVQADANQNGILLKDGQPVFKTGFYKGSSNRKKTGRTDKLNEALKLPHVIEDPDVAVVVMSFTGGVDKGSAAQTCIPSKFWLEEEDALAPLEKHYGIPAKKWLEFRKDLMEDGSYNRLSGVAELKFDEQLLKIREWCIENNFLDEEILTQEFIEDHKYALVDVLGLISEEDAKKVDLDEMLNNIQEDSAEVQPQVQAQPQPQVAVQPQVQAQSEPFQPIGGIGGGSPIHTMKPQSGQSALTGFAESTLIKPGV